MEELIVLERNYYEEPKKGISIVGYEPITIIGEQVAEYEGVIYDQYIYNIDGYKPANGKPFASMKANIVLL